MYVIEVISGNRHKVEVLLLKPEELGSIQRKRFFFDWKLEKEFEIYKICLVSNSEILGLMSVEDIPEEWRIHIRLLSVSTENKGKSKTYDRIVGNLLTFISKVALKKYEELACVSLKPKRQIAQHYIDRYGMNITGATLSIELREIFKLINEYDT